ncbi:MAG: dihydrolipoamide acetyltransferase family protein [Azospirillaceae bacterium]
MAYSFKLQDPGEGIHEAEILELLVSPGDAIAAGDNVLVAETDKAAIEIPSPVAGTVEEIKVAEGDIVSVGEVLMLIDRGEAGDDEDNAPREDAAGEETDDADDEAVDEEDAAAADARTAKPTAGDAKAGGERADTDDRSGPTRKDVAAEDEPGKAEPRVDESGRDESAQGKARSATPAKATPAKATPAVRKLARALDVDLKAVDGSGEDGRVLAQDVRRAAGETSGEEAARESADGQTGEPQRRKLRSIRRATARHMAQAWSEIPHVLHVDRADITALERLRVSHGETVEAAGGKLTLTPLLVKALAAALREHPSFNARFDAEAEEIILAEERNIGVALDSDWGLVVPVLRQADRKSVIDLALELSELSRRLADERPSREMLQGGTFTLTNVGAIGGTGLSPIINHPQVAILGAARAALERVVTGSIEAPEERVALVLPLSLAFDHRVVDGADAARFMNDLKRLLEDPDELLIHN